MPKSKTQNMLERIAQTALRLAKQNGATAAKIWITKEIGYEVVARNQKAESIEFHDNDHIQLTVYRGARKGFASASMLALSKLPVLVEAALRTARFAEKDPCVGLPDRTLMATNYPALDLYHPTTMTPKEALQKALRAERIAQKSDRRIKHVEGISICTSAKTSVFANSYGFIGSILSSSHHRSCMLLADGEKGMEMEGDFSVARRERDLLSFHKIIDSARHRVLRRLNAQKIRTGRMPVIFDPMIAKRLMSNFVTAITGSQLYCRESFLVDSLGKQIFPEHIHIFERPHLLRGVGSAPFDGEGVQTHDKDFVHQGKVVNYVLSHYTACKLGMKTTGNCGGVYNLKVLGNTLSLPEMIKKMYRGVIVTDLIGDGVNLLTGDYSRGAVGLWVDRGEIQYPVAEFTIAGNLRDMFAGIIAVGADIDHRHNVQMGSLLIDPVTISST